MKMLTLRRLVVVVAPLPLAILVGWLVGEGHLSFGGGDKDIFVMVPVLFWTLTYLIAAAVLWARHATIGRMATGAALAATGALVIAWTIVFVVAWLKFG